MADPQKPELSVTLDASDDGLSATVGGAEKNLQGLEKQFDQTGKAADRLAASTEKAGAATASGAAAAARATATASAAAAGQAAAQTAVSASAAASANSMGLLTKAGTVLFSAMGGWIGVATIAASAILYLAQQQSSAEKAAASLTKVTDQLNAAHERTAAAAAAAVEAKKREIQASLDHAKAMKAELEAQMAMDQPAEFYSVASAEASHYDSVISTLTETLRKYGIAAQQASEDLVTKNIDEAIARITEQNAQLKLQVDTYGKSAGAAAQYRGELEATALAEKATTDAQRQKVAAYRQQVAASVDLENKLTALNEATKKQEQATRAAAAAQRQQEQDARAVAQAYATLENIHEQMVGSLDPVNKAWQESAKSIRSAADAEGVLIAHGKDLKTAQEDLSRAIDEITTKRNQDIAAAQRQLDVSGRLSEQLEQEARIASLSDRDQAVARAGMQAESELRARNIQLTDDQIAAERARVEAVAAGAYDMQKAAEEQRAIAEEFSGYWENAAGSISRAFGDLTVSGLRKWRDFWNQVKSITSQFVSDIIAQYLRLNIIGPLLSSAMQSVAGMLGITGSLGGSSLVQAAQYVGGGSIFGTQAGSVGGGVQAGGNGASSLSGLFSNLSAAKNLYTYVAGLGAAGAGSTAGGTAAIVNAGGTVGGDFGAAAGGFYAPGAAPVVSGATGVAPYTAPWYASYGGAAVGAYWGLNRGSGGLSTAAATVTGAVGGYAAGTAAATAMSSGISAGLGAIPVVGWIALAAMVIDQVSGGKLFGTKWKPTQGQTYLSLSDAGGDATQLITQKKQGALFSGAKWKTEEVAASAEAEKAADDLYNSIKKSMVQGAQQLGVDVPSMINAQLQIQTDYNSKGQVKSTEYLVNYLGRTWKEATADAAAQRIGAEAIIATVAASAGQEAQRVAEQWRDSAEALADGAQLLMQAQTDINHGNSLLALGTSATLTQITLFVEQMQTDGETLAQTYQRLAQASAQYLQFVGQFAPQSANFGSSLEAINQQMLSNIDQANALAQAAGLQGAREQDLANIHQYAAQQAAAAIAQLDSAAQDLVSKLYGVTDGSLAAISAQLDAMKAKVQASTQTAIGDLSPLNDKQKLDLALKGLRSGITSADDVLNLGRKLYSSSSDYTGLYNQVMSIVGGSGAGDAGASLDQYNQLAAQQAQLQAQADATARFNDAKQLAQYVADISTTHGVSYQDAASGLGLSLQDLAHDLGLTNLTGYLDQLKAEDIAGTTKTAASSIVDAIRGIGSDIVSAILGAPVVKPGPTSASGGGSTDAQQQAILDALNKIIQQNNAIEQNTGATAKTNDALLSNSKRDTLRNALQGDRTIS